MRKRWAYSKPGLAALLILLCVAAVTTAWFLLPLPTSRRLLSEGDRIRVEETSRILRLLPRKPVGRGSERGDRSR